jgi:L-aminopeptidase/D-esterase-like protein
VGVLVQCNYGRRARLSVAGVPVGEEITDLMPCYMPLPDGTTAGRACTAGSGRGSDLEAAAPLPHDQGQGQGSIIVVVATDAPLLPHQLKRVAKRAALGVGRMGGMGENSSGDIFIAFSTANPAASADTGMVQVTAIPNAAINPVFEGAIEGTSEAILNALLAAETMTGANGFTMFALPPDRLLAVLRKHGRMR